jgi:hypothetical protein
MPTTYKYIVVTLFGITLGAASQAEKIEVECLNIGRFHSGQDTYTCLHIGGPKADTGDRK